MDNAACLRLDAFLRSQASRFGAPELGDQSVLDEGRREDGTRRTRPPRERLIERIDALERHLLLLHRGVYKEAMTKIEAALDRGATEFRARPSVPETVLAMIPSATDEGEMAFDLAHLPDLSQPLRRLQLLRGRILEDNNAGA
ncbi:hypothetical protein [Brevundimonas sp. FT23042]|uniref:hypothetical protein n=1 Tax=Brevundimonas sp. FT23042 TaxID=3393749 RepID=UPI003B588B0C